MPTDPLRFETPLYTLKEVAWYLGVPPTTLGTWANRRTATNVPLITHQKTKNRYEATVPFIGMAEAFVISAFKRHTDGKRLKMRYVLDVLQKLEEGLEGLEGGVEHALASNRLKLHGQAILVNLADDPTTAEHVEVMTENGVFEKVVEGHLENLTYAPDDGLAERIVLPDTPEPLIELNPRRAYGRPVYIKGWARMEDVLARFHAREHPKVIARDFGLTEGEVLDTVRAFPTRAREAA